MHIDDDLRFALQIAGQELTEEPPSPGSPLARILNFAAEHGYESLTDEHFELAVAGRL
ncbi:hypothetical protein [Streptomyces sp. NPDC002547]